MSDRAPDACYPAPGGAFDSFVSRVIHGIGRVRPEASVAPSEDAILARVEPDLAAARALKRWWESPGRNLSRTFELDRTYHQPESAYGFFGEARSPSGTLPVMGVVQDMFYDQPKAPREHASSADNWSRRQLREFVLRYFMRVADFREPEPYARASHLTEDRRAEAWPGALSWCPQSRVVRKGFGFSQHFYKLRRSGQIGRFAESERNAIVDLRELSTKYEWIVAKVKIYDFVVRFRLLENGPELGLNLDEESYLAIAADFIEDGGCPGASGPIEYGLGYAYLRNPEPGPLAYGPGDFEAAFKRISFRTMEDGRIFVHMEFVSNRPTGVISLRFDPIAAAGRLADLFTFGLSSRILGGRTLRSSAPAPSFDPVYAYVSLLNGLTAGRAERDWCVSRDQLDVDFLVQHFHQHYKSLASSLAAWREVPDWLNEARLPEWVITGQSS